MNLAVINTETHQINVFDGRKAIATNTFSRALDMEETEAYRANPKGFLDAVTQQVKSTETI